MPHGKNNYQWLIRDAAKSWFREYFSGWKGATNCSEKQRNGETLKVQMSKKAGSANQKACIAFP